MKKLAVMFAMLLVGAFAFCESMKGFYYCDFGCTKSECIKTLKGEGWKVTKEDGNYVGFEKENGTYEGKPVSSMYFIFDNGKLWQAGAVFQNNPSTELFESYTVMKYGLEKDYYSPSGTTAGTRSYTSRDRKVQFIAAPTDGGKKLCITVLYYGI